jgi:nucleoside 2-deoxyribosyltransferase
LKKTIYLSGPEIVTQDNQAMGLKGTSWRSVAFQVCLKQGIQVINPLTEVKSTLNTNGRSFIAGDRSRKEVEQALGLIDRCDFLLANLYSADESSWIPLTYAHNKGKQTVVWTPFPLSPWLASYANASFESLHDAIEFIIAQSHDDQKSIIDWSIQYETSLKERSEKFPIDGDADFQYFPGDDKRSVLLIAPHATSYWHLGGLLETESYTGALGAALSRLTGNHAIVTSYCSAEDSLYTFAGTSSLKPITNPLISFIQKIIDIHKIKLLLVLRGNSWQAERDLKVKLFLSSENTPDYANLFFSILKRQAAARHIGYKHENAQPDEDLHRLASAIKIPIVEMTVHKAYLTPHMQRAQYCNLVTMLEAVLDEV